jgi:hypothetical protein
MEGVKYLFSERKLDDYREKRNSNRIMTHPQNWRF